MSSCTCCERSLTDALFLIIDNTVYKSCPECSKQVGEHVFYKCPDAFGTTPNRITQQNPIGLQSYCGPCRSNKTGQHDKAIKCSQIEACKGYIIEEVRILPMSSNLFGTYKEARDFLLDTLPEQDYRYYFMTSKMNCPKNTLVLFQCGGRIIGYAIHNETKPLDVPTVFRDGGTYRGYYKFFANSINLFDKLITAEEFSEFCPSFKSFNQSHQFVPPAVLPAIFKALNEQSGFFNPTMKISLPEEIAIDDEKLLIEGAKKRITVNAYERNPSARRVCISHYKKTNDGVIKCEICGVNFGKTYGINFYDKIHIHHLVEISTIGKEYEVDPINDLLPVCPNCHMIIHSRKPAYTPQEIKKMLGRK